MSRIFFSLFFLVRTFFYDIRRIFLCRVSHSSYERIVLIRGPTLQVVNKLTNVPTVYCDSGGSYLQAPSQKLCILIWMMKEQYLILTKYLNPTFRHSMVPSSRYQDDSTFIQVSSLKTNWKKHHANTNIKMHIHYTSTYQTGNANLP